MNSYLGLPLHVGDHFVGMLGLANHAGGFDEVRSRTSSHSRRRSAS